jgi:hypothetical protein
MVKHMNIMNRILDKNLESCAKMRLDSILSVIPIVEIKKSGTHVAIGKSMFDVVADIVVSGKPMKLVAEVVKRAEPRFARMAALDLRSRMQSVKNGYGILMAPYLSPAAVQVCRESRVGCMDLSGNAFLHFGNVFIERSGRANAYVESRPLKSLFSPKTSRVLRALLLNPSKRWHVEELSKAAGISLGLASKAKQALLAQEWVEEDGRRLVLLKPFDLLKEWARNYSFKKNRLFSFYSGLAEEALETALKTECEKRTCQYGLALFSGAGRVAPYVRFPKFFAYIDGDIAEVAEALELKKVESGANVTLLDPYDGGVFQGLRQIGEASVVSDIQLYLDLMSYGARGEEAAQAIFEQRIEPLW